jgi:hypothetical protein
MSDGLLIKHLLDICIAAKMSPFRYRTVKTGSVACGIGSGRCLSAKQDVIDLGHGHKALLHVEQIDGHWPEGRYPARAAFAVSLSEL